MSTILNCLDSKVECFCSVTANSPTLFSGRNDRIVVQYANVVDRDMVYEEARVITSELGMTTVFEYSINAICIF